MLTSKIINKLPKNPGTSCGMPLFNNGQKIEIRVPVKIPAIAPFGVTFFVCKDKSKRGPNAAPNPDHAYKTELYKEDELTNAISIAIIAIAKVAILVTNI